MVMNFLSSSILIAYSAISYCCWLQFKIRFLQTHNLSFLILKTYD
uniref:Uncharacterized protein n=1 Tax=Rhizophora mucronata TaxID=61149 RepID=A0A2P2IXV6_RHIMU